MKSESEFKSSLGKAVASAVAADVIAAPSIGKAIREGLLDPTGLRNMMMRDLENDVRGVSGKPLFPHLRAVMRTQMNVEEAKLKGGMSQWAELATAIAGAASGVYSAKISADASKDIAKIQAATATRVASLQASADKLALAQAQGFPGAASPAKSWVLPAAIAGGVAVTGFIGYLLLRKKRR